MQILDKLTEEFWWDVARNCEYCTFFQTPMWSQLATGYYSHYADVSMGFILDNGTRVVFPLLVEKKSGPFQSLLSTFEKCYGGIIADGPVSNEELEKIFNEVISFKTVRLDYLESPFGPKIKHRDCFHEEVDSTYIVNLDSDFDTFFSQIKKNRQRSYRKGIGEGVEIIQATTIDEFKVYFDVYELSTNRWKERFGVVYPYGWSLFENCYRLAQQYPNAIKLWLAKLGDVVIAGDLVFYWAGHAIVWHGMTHPDYFKYQPMTVLDVETIRDCIDKGIKMFDFNPSGGFEGVVQYKESFGTNKTEISRWTYENNSVLAPLRKFRNIKEKIVSPDSQQHKAAE